MLDINFVRNNAEVVKKAIKDKGYDIDLDQILSLDTDRKTLAQEVDALRQERNKISSQMKGGKPDAKLIEEGKKVKQQLSELETKLSELETDFQTRFKAIPNPAFEDVPLGGEDDSVERNGC